MLATRNSAVGRLEQLGESFVLKPASYSSTDTPLRCNEKRMKSLAEFFFAHDPQEAFLLSMLREHDQSVTGIHSFLRVDGVQALLLLRHG